MSTPHTNTSAISSRAARGLLACAALLAAGARLAPPVAAQQGATGPAPASADDAPPASPALLAAEASLAEARRAKEAAYSTLEALVNELGDDYVALTTGPDAAARQHTLVLAFMDSLPTAQARLASEVAKGRAVQRGTRRQILHEAFAGPIAQAAPVDSRLCAWLAARVADRLSTRDAFDGLTEDQLLALLRDLFPKGLTWYEFWNQAFHADLPEALALQKTTAAYEAAGLAVDRLRHPERYGTRGEVAPDGMVVVPGGNYELGPNTGWERPAHRVSLKVFALDRHEVSKGQYLLYVNSLPAEKRRAALPRGWGVDDKELAAIPADQRDYPVIHVNWEQAAAYAAWAGKRLPTEDEWEAAAAGIAGRSFPWGNEFHAECANGGDNQAAPMPVESFPQGVSPVGCFDMAGNAWEWTATLEDGKDVTVLPAGLVNVVVRGGGFSSRREELSTHYRWTAPGQDAFASPRYTRPIGFRCAKDL